MVQHGSICYVFILKQSCFICFKYDWGRTAVVTRFLYSCTGVAEQLLLSCWINKEVSRLFCFLPVKEWKSWWDQTVSLISPNSIYLSFRILKHAEWNVATILGFKIKMKCCGWSHQGFFLFFFVFFRSTVIKILLEKHFFVLRVVCREI